LHRSGRHRDFANAFLIRQATPARAGVNGRRDEDRRCGGRGGGGTEHRVRFGRLGDNASAGRTALACSPGANDANLPCKSRHISRHRAAEGARAGSATLSRYPPRSPSPHALSLSFFLSLLRITIPRIRRRRWMKSFPSCYPGSYRAAAPTTARKFRDVNAIGLRAAVLSPVFPAYINGHEVPSNVSAGVSQSAARRHRNDLYHRMTARLSMTDNDPLQHDRIISITRS